MLVYGVLAIVIMAGALLSAKDYRTWLHLETDKFGQGYEDNSQPAESLTRMYQNTTMGMRIKYPTDWNVKENNKYVSSKPYIHMPDLLYLGQRVEVAQIGPFVKVEMERVNMSLPDLADREVKNLKSRGIVLSREREYVGSDTANITMLTWEENIGGEQMVRQEGMASKENSLVIISAMTPKGDWDKWANTFKELYKSLVFI